MGRLGWFVVALCLLGGATTVSADVISEEVAACRSKSKGDACTAGDVKGTCEDSQCCRIDYSTMKDPDGPKTKCSACLECKAAAKKEPEADAPKKGCATGTGALGFAGIASLLGAAAILARLRRRPS